MQRIDEDGTWEVIENGGCISQRLIEPSQKYIDEHPDEFIPKQTPVTLTNNAIVIKQKTTTANPAPVTVTDKTTYWVLIATRNVISEVINQVTYYTYEYIETTVPKATYSQSEVEAIVAAKVDDLFLNAEYPAYSIYDDNTSSTSLLKLAFALIDQNKSLAARVTELEGGV